MFIDRHKLTHSRVQDIFLKKVDWTLGLSKNSPLSWSHRNYISFRSILISPSHLCLGLPSVLFPSRIQYPKRVVKLAELDQDKPKIEIENEVVLIINLNHKRISRVLCGSVLKPSGYRGQPPPPPKYSHTI